MQHAYGGICLASRSAGDRGIGPRKAPARYPREPSRRTKRTGPCVSVAIQWEYPLAGSAATRPGTDPGHAIGDRALEAPRRSLHEAFQIDVEEVDGDYESGEPKQNTFDEQRGPITHKPD